MFPSIGDLCFAHLRGYKPSPAVIISETKTKNKFVVQWLESNQTSSVDKKKVSEVTKTNLQANITDKTMKDPVFRKGVDVLRNKYMANSVVFDYFHVGQCQPVDNPVLDTGKNSISPREQDEITLLIQNIIAQLPDSNAVPDDELNNEGGEDVGLQQIIPNENPVGGEMAKQPKGKKKGNKSKTRKQATKTHTLPTEERNQTEFEETNQVGDEVGLNQIIHRENPFGGEMAKQPRGKQKVNTSKKRKPATKTLQENEITCNKHFKEKIIQDGGGFMCKDCNFSTAWRLMAKTHAQTCGIVKRKGKQNVKKSCSICSEMFANKRQLNNHFKTNHAEASYRCTSCGKQFTSKQSLMNHLRVHDKNYTPSFHCDLCEYKTKDQWHLDRHNQRKHHFLLEEEFVVNMAEYTTHDQSTGILNLKMTNIAIDCIGQEIEVIDKEQVTQSLDTWAAMDVVYGDVGFGIKLENEGSLDDIRVPLTVYWKEEITNSNEQECVIMEEGSVNNIITEDDLWKEYRQTESSFIDNLHRSLFPGGDIVVNIVDSLVSEVTFSRLEIAKEIVSSLVSTVVEECYRKNFLCPQCGWKCRDSYNLNSHIRNLHGKKVNCKLCGKVINDKSSLKVHIKTCHLHCPEPGCKKVFSRLDYYERHQSNHQKLNMRMI